RVFACATAFLFCAAQLASAGILAEETWDTPGDARDFALSHVAGGTPGTLGTPGGFGNPVSGLEVTVDTTADFGPNTDTISSTGGDAAPFLGAYNTAQPEGISFDFFQLTQPTDLRFFVVANGTTWYHTIDTSGFANGTWNTVSVSMDNSTGWFETILGSPDFVNDVGTSVGEIGFRISYAANTAGQQFGFDNLQRTYAVPEPETYAALSFALLCLGITFRRRLQDSLNDAMASIRA
ncbi:MAG: PEP-CTERM sorting domain-containing protein, partial [Kiritimatiellae bacterium]|nr:PEP-CTERM sorting domain-containing protein [Kiritimatiellia bacterium]